MSATAEQLSLFDLTRRRREPKPKPAPSVPYVKGSVTSETAAKKQKREKMEADRALLRRYLLAHGPADDSAMQEGTGLDGNSQRPRRGDLEQLGHIEKAGRGVSRLGNPAQLWQLTEAGRRAAREGGG
jgi:hypothetical protein